MQPFGGERNAIAILSPDRQVTLHPVADCPTDDTPGMKVQDHNEIQPAFTGPDVAYITGSFLVRAIRSEVLIQQVGRDVKRVIALRRSSIFLGPDDLNAVITHQTAHTPVPNLHSQLLQLFGYPWPSVTL